MTKLIFHQHYWLKYLSSFNIYLRKRFFFQYHLWIKWLGVSFFSAISFCFLSSVHFIRYSKGIYNKAQLRSPNPNMREKVPPIPMALLIHYQPDFWQFQATLFTIHITSITQAKIARNQTIALHPNSQKLDQRQSMIQTPSRRFHVELELELECCCGVSRKSSVLEAVRPLSPNYRRARPNFLFVASPIEDVKYNL
jgi:hypothetical protein